MKERKKERKNSGTIFQYVGIIVENIKESFLGNYEYLNFIYHLQHVE